MVMGDGLARLTGYRFEVRYSAGALARATVAADLAAGADAYFASLFSGVEPDIALIVADETGWVSRQPYGLAFFNDDADQLRAGILVMPVGRGDFWAAMVRDIREASPDRYAELVAAYPNGQGGVDLQPFFDLITIHELGHAFEVLGDLRLQRPGSARSLSTSPCTPSSRLISRRPVNTRDAPDHRRGKRTARRSDARRGIQDVRRTRGALHGRR